MANELVRVLVRAVFSGGAACEAGGEGEGDGGGLTIDN